MNQLATTKSAKEACKEVTLFPWAAQQGVAGEEVSHADGVYYFTQDGKAILDFSSQLINMNIGHGNKKVMDAMKEQIDKFCYLHPAAVYDAKIELGNKLAQATEGKLTKTFYTLSGSEANENAIKMARVLTGRSKILSLTQSYHGAGYGALSASGDPRKFAMDGSAMPHVFHAENPFFYRCPFGTTSPEACSQLALADMERVLKFNQATSFAAILLEGESGTSGCLGYPPGYLKGVRALADKYGILLIVDEVMSGFGRCGKWFGYQLHDIVPDMLTMAKGITGGYFPLGGVMVSPAIASFFETHTLPCGLTNAAHPIGIAAANAAMDVYLEEHLIENAATNGEWLFQQLKGLQKKYACIGDVRGKGLLLCLDLVKSQSSKEPMAPFNASGEEMKEMKMVQQALSAAGLFTIVRWNYIFIAPPLSADKDELMEGLAKLEEGLKVAETFYKG